LRDVGWSPTQKARIIDGNTDFGIPAALRVVQISQLTASDIITGSHAGDRAAFRLGKIFQRVSNALRVINYFKNLSL
jgi:hypothetical protein